MAPFIFYSISTVLMSISGPKKVISPICYGINITVSILKQTVMYLIALVD